MAPRDPPIARAARLCEPRATPPYNDKGRIWECLRDDPFACLACGQGDDEGWAWYCNGCDFWWDGNHANSWKHKKMLKEHRKRPGQPRLLDPNCRLGGWARDLKRHHVCYDGWAIPAAVLDQECPFYSTDHSGGTAVPRAPRRLLAGLCA